MDFLKLAKEYNRAFLIKYNSESCIFSIDVYSDSEIFNKVLTINLTEEMIKQSGSCLDKAILKAIQKV